MKKVSSFMYAMAYEFLFLLFWSSVHLNRTWKAIRKFFEYLTSNASIRHLSVDFRYILDLSLPNNSKSTTLELFLYLVIAETLGTH